MLKNVRVQNEQKKWASFGSKATVQQQQNTQPINSPKFVIFLKPIRFQVRSLCTSFRPNDLEPKRSPESIRDEKDQKHGIFSVPVRVQIRARPRLDSESDDSSDRTFDGSGDLVENPLTCFVAWGLKHDPYIWLAYNGTDPVQLQMPRDVSRMIHPKIETTRAARNLEVKVYSRGGIEDSAMLTSKCFQMLYMEEAPVIVYVVDIRSGRCSLSRIDKDKRSLESCFGWVHPQPKITLSGCFESSACQLIAKKIQEVENVYKEYTIGIFKVEFQINLIPTPMEVINLEQSDCGLCRPVGSYPRPKWGIVGRVRRERTNQDGVLSGHDDEKVTVVWVRGLIGLRLGRSV
ncbi:LOW QUALITY PROTEIN: hypothetical protein OSB04_005460 [Centaurea solstitialis]|uniref:Uncharacterized protein n=1 Tax=Centaurea solstitialis TaxID=347529 RepID=A0AA38WPP0_9ASTR|nr:LOW QUALITY PROTEIN: hypothetical protein OSB04_005460 [Centaurea solstitialis]